MIKNSRKIREMKEAVSAERNIRIRNRMMEVPDVLKGRSTRTASDFADMDRRTMQLWVARFNEGGINGLRNAPGRGRASRARYGRIKRRADKPATSEHHETPKDLTHAVSEYFRTVQSGSTSANFCTATYEVRFSMSVTLVMGRPPLRMVDGESILLYLAQRYRTCHKLIFMPSAIVVLVVSFFLL